MKRFLLMLLMALVMMPAVAQKSKSKRTRAKQTTVVKKSKRVRELEDQKAKLQKNLKKSKRALDRTRNDVNKGKKHILVLDREITTRVQYIQQTQRELDSLNHEIDVLQLKIQRLDSVLTCKKQRYVQSLRMAQAYRKVNSSLLFALSADDITQMYRRLRYTREYAAHQRAQGEDVQRQQVKVLEHQNRMLALKSEANQKMQTLISERAKLAQQQAEEQRNVKTLQKKQKGLQKQVDDQNKQIVALQKKIDEVVAYELEQARKRAEAEARRKAEAAAKRKGTQATSKSTAKKTATSKDKWQTAEDKKLSGGFAQNKGRLPVPITGQYIVGARYGANTSKKRNVTLTNKGVNYVGRKGARARTVFDGEVSAVFSLGGMKNVLVRHGSYISVYCNLSSVIVKKGQKVKTRDLLGTVASDYTGAYVLHFQLRKETTRLNPEQWIGR